MENIKLAYIIPFLNVKNEPDRERNLLFILKNLNIFFEKQSFIRFCVIEQGEHPTIEQKVHLISNDILYYFIYKSGLFNKCWAFNVAYHLLTKIDQFTHFVFADADVILRREDYEKYFSFINHYDVVLRPKIIRDLNKETTENIIQKGIFDFNEKDYREKIHFSTTRSKFLDNAGGLTIFKHHIFEETGGWDERFEGWGWEDTAMYYCLVNQKRNIINPDSFMLYHLFHGRPYNPQKHSHYNANVSFFNEYKTKTNKIISLSEKGKIDKYKK